LWTNSPKLRAAKIKGFTVVTVLSISSVMWQLVGSTVGRKSHVLGTVALS